MADYVSGQVATSKKAQQDGGINIDGIMNLLQDSGSSSYGSIYQNAINSLAGYDTAIATLKAQNAAGLAAINQTYQNQAAKATQDLVSSGLSSGTVAATTAAGIAGQRTMAQQTYAAQQAKDIAELQAAKANATAGIYGNWAQTAANQRTQTISSGGSSSGSGGGYTANYSGVGIDDSKGQTSSTAANQDIYGNVPYVPLYGNIGN